MRHLHRPPHLRWNATQFQIPALRARRLHQTYQRTQPAAVHKLHRVHLQHDVPTLRNRIPN